MGGVDDFQGAEALKLIGGVLHQQNQVFFLQILSEALRRSTAVVGGIQGIQRFNLRGREFGDGEGAGVQSAHVRRSR